MELELELILTKILELELELNPKNVAGIGIGINSIFFGMTNGLHIHIYIPVIACKKIYSFSGFFVDVGAFPRSWKTLGVAQYFGVWPKNWDLGQYFKSLPKVLGVWPKKCDSGSFLGVCPIFWNFCQFWLALN